MGGHHDLPPVARSSSLGIAPGFVYGIFVSCSSIFNIFALNHWLQYPPKGRWRDYLVGEKAYIALSLTAKSALAWQIFAGTLAADEPGRGRVPDEVRE